ncbi:hypothetical protein IEQ34_016577 [Dendrobium chrysotoxum]|uniref:Uncharacterized protein n=1 Tax=Dendrobium chrysotoxum TaxID=161865 RepID=A0AAV7GGV0_DENCH|nr:hypothetical protein IEQ34_016577 [Dendrobium chrysotoxum]
MKERRLGNCRRIDTYFMLLVLTCSSTHIAIIRFVVFLMRCMLVKVSKSVRGVVLPGSRNKASLGHFYTPSNSFVALCHQAQGSKPPYDTFDGGGGNEITVVHAALSRALDRSHSNGGTTWHHQNHRFETA